jgi:polysaccharide biosynthesis transport protein
MPISDAEIENEEPVELTEYLRVIRERWWIIVAAIVIVTGAALFISLQSTPQYRSYARLLYQKTNLEQALFGSQVFTNTNQDREVQTGAEVIKLEPIAEAVAAQLGSQRSPTSLLGMVSVKPKSNANVVDISAEGPDAKETADVANAFAEQFVLFRQSTDRATVAAARELVKQQLDQLSAEDASSDYGLMLKDKYESLRIIESMQNGGFTIVQRASTPSAPFSPQTVRDSLIAFFVGLVLGVGFAFLLDRMDRRVRDEKTLETELGVPVLASVPLVKEGWFGGTRVLKGKSRGRSRAPVGFSSDGAILESFRTLRSNLQYFSLDKKQPVWLVTSCAPKEGKTTTTINLGLSLALSGKRVILIEADLRRPMLNEYLGLRRGAGLSNLLAGSKRLEDVLQFVKATDFMPPEKRVNPADEKHGILQRNMYAIASGPLPPNPAELLASQRMTDLIQELAPMADYLLIDTPPVLAVSDALALARHVDGVIVVARLDATSRDSIREVREIFERAGTRIIGAVAAGTDKPTSYYKKRYGYGYGFGYGYGYEYTNGGTDQN